MKRKLLNKLGGGNRKKRSFDIDVGGKTALEGEPMLLGGGVEDVAFCPADFAVETEIAGGGAKRRTNLYQKHRSKSRFTNWFRKREARILLELEQMGVA